MDTGTEVIPMTRPEKWLFLNTDFYYSAWDFMRDGWRLMLR